MVAPTEDELRAAMMTFGRLTHDYWKLQKENALLRAALERAAPYVNGRSALTQEIKAQVDKALAPFDPFGMRPVKNDSRVG